MKKFLSLIFVFFVSLTFGQSRVSQSVFAKIQGSKFLIVGDTVKLKARISHLIFPKNKKQVSLSIEIQKGQTFGETVEDYYFVSFNNKEKNVIIAKWLERVGDNLLLINHSTDDNYWQVLTTACIGKDDCSPQIAIIDSKKNWGCGHKLICSAENNCKKISAAESE